MVSAFLLECNWIQQNADWRLGKFKTTVKSKTVFNKWHLTESEHLKQTTGVRLANSESLLSPFSFHFTM